MTLDVALRHAFPGLTLDVAFSAQAPGVTALFGPSGAGKSTVIAIVAGLLRPDWARIALPGAVLADTGGGVWTPPERRRVGLVFQDAWLFPHMTVLGNLRYGLRRAPPGPILLDDVVGLLGIEALLARRPATLSGGERSRVAIGRTLLAQPRLLLMDEPLASLDTARRAEILPYLGRLRTTLRLPILYVTHALDEVVRLADTLVLLEAGRVRAAGPLDAVLARSDLPLAFRDDAAAILAGRIAAHHPDRRLTEVTAAGRSILVPLIVSALGVPVRLRVPAREIVLATRAPEAVSLHNILPATVTTITEDKARHAALIGLALDGGALLARVTPDAVIRLGLRPGVPALALFKSVAVEILD